MEQVRLREDPHRFINYYESQVGGALPGFYGAPVMYGRGIGSIFSRLFRFVSPLVKKGFAIAKPHLKSAASNIASDVIKTAVGSMTNRQNQEGSGGIMVLSRRQRRRPPGDRVFSLPNKRASHKRKKSVGRSKPKGRKSARSDDIF
nr:TPA_asm: cupiennin [Larimichthys croaker adintovirus]